MQWNADLYKTQHQFVAGYGADLLGLVVRAPSMKILDVGCGTGELTERLAALGEVTGIDSSAEMIHKARASYPSLRFEQKDVLDLDEERVDLVFSNAVLHWVRPPERAARNMARALNPGGQLVVEFGGRGNNAKMLAALRQTLRDAGFADNAAIDFWYYPSIPEHTRLLEKSGLEVVYASLFDRWTPLQGDEGLANWFRMFGTRFFTGMSAAETASVIERTVAALEPTHRVDGVWHADYRRIRVKANKPP